MRTKNELHLVNLANGLIGKYPEIRGDFFSGAWDFRKWIDRGTFGERIMVTIHKDVAKMNLKTAMKVARLKLVDSSTLYRKLPSDNATKAEYAHVHIAGFGEKTWKSAECFRYNASVVITGVIYEILATENIFRGKPIQDDYENPPRELAKFVKKVRLAREHIIKTVMCEDLFGDRS